MVLSQLNISTTHLDMEKLSARWVHLFMNDNEHKRVLVSKEYMEMLKCNRNDFCRLVLIVG